MRGHYKQAFTMIDSLVDDLESKHNFIQNEGTCDAALEYMFFKLVYFKAKL